MPIYFIDCGPACQVGGFLVHSSLLSSVSPQDLIDESPQGLDGMLCGLSQVPVHATASIRVTAVHRRLGKCWNCERCEC